MGSGAAFIYTVMSEHDFFYQRNDFIVQSSVSKFNLVTTHFCTQNIFSEPITKPLNIKLETSPQINVKQGYT
jgi:hypothetical protein